MVFVMMALFKSFLVLYSSVILPILSKESRNMLFRSSMLWMVLWSSNGGMVVEWSCNGWTDALWPCEGWTAAMDILSGCKVFLIASRCQHCGVFLWHNPLSSWVLVAWYVKLSFLVYTTKNVMGMSLLVINVLLWGWLSHVLLCCHLCRTLDMMWLADWRVPSSGSPSVVRVFQKIYPAHSYV